MAKIFLTLSGPSGAGKTPLQNAVNELVKINEDDKGKGLLSVRPVLCHSRKPREGEIHGENYYFLPPALIKSLAGNDNFLVAPVRSDWQAIDLLQVKDLLQSHDLVFAEVFYTFGPRLSHLASESDFETYSVFLLPVDKDPIEEREEIVNVMRKKLELRGTSKDNIEERAQSAPREMQKASQFTHYLHNPASEDMIDEWGKFGIRNGKEGSGALGDNAKWLVETFIKIATGKLGKGKYRRTESGGIKSV